MRTKLSLFALDRGALEAFSAELRAALSDDARDALITLLGLGGSFADKARSTQRAVDLFLVPEDKESGLYPSLRRVAKKRALSYMWTSESPALEGRLREWGGLREDAEAARLVDALLDVRRIPWFLRRPGATGGWLEAAEREALSEALTCLEDPPDELVAFGEALAAVEGDVLCHDGLA